MEEQWAKWKEETLAQWEQPWENRSSMLNSAHKMRKKKQEETDKEHSQSKFEDW